MLSFPNDMIGLLKKKKKCAKSGETKARTNEKCLIF